MLFDKQVISDEFMIFVCKLVIMICVRQKLISSIISTNELSEVGILLSGRLASCRASGGNQRSLQRQENSRKTSQSGMSTDL